jgi:N-acetylglutamate synthase-like GNAT family acetyltransferase
MFFLYFGLWTTILAHAAFNATLGALPLLRSGEPYFFFSGLVVILVLVSPILPGLVISLKRWLLRGARPPPTPQVQLATSDDMPGLLALPVEDASWEACLADPQAVVVCLKAGGELVGAAAGCLEGESGVLTQVYVSPAWRNRYWGSRLTGAVRSGLEAMGAKTIRAAIPAAQRDAASFLAGQGWLAETRLYAPGPLPSYKTLWSDLRSLVPRRGRLFRKP